MPPFLTAPLPSSLPTTSSTGAPWLFIAATNDIGKTTLIQDSLSTNTDMFARKSATGVKSSPFTSYSSRPSNSSSQARRESLKDSVVVQGQPKIDSPSAKAQEGFMSSFQSAVKESAAKISADRSNDNVTSKNTPGSVPAKRPAEVELVGGLSSTKGKRKKVATAKGAAFVAETSARKRKAAKQKNNEAQTKEPKDSADPKEPKASKSSKDKINTPGVGVFSVTPGVTSSATPHVNGSSASAPSSDEQSPVAQARAYQGSTGEGFGVPDSPSSRWRGSYNVRSPHAAPSPLQETPGLRALPKAQKLSLLRDVRSSPTALEPLPHPELSVPPMAPTSIAPRKNKESLDVISIGSSSPEDATPTSTLNGSAEENRTRDKGAGSVAPNNQTHNNTTPVLLQKGVDKFFNDLVTIKSFPESNPQVNRQLNDVVAHLCQCTFYPTENISTTKTPPIVEKFKSMQKMHDKVDFLTKRIGVQRLDTEGTKVDWFRTWDEGGRWKLSGQPILAEHPMPSPAFPSPIIGPALPPRSQYAANGVSLNQKSPLEHKKPDSHARPPPKTSRKNQSKEKRAAANAEKPAVNESPSIASASSTAATETIGRPLIEEALPKKGQEKINTKLPDNGKENSDISPDSAEKDLMETLGDTSVLGDPGAATTSSHPNGTALTASHTETQKESPEVEFKIEELNLCVSNLLEQHGLNDCKKDEVFKKGFTVRQLASEVREKSRKVFDWSRFGNDERQLNTCELFLNFYWKDTKTQSLVNQGLSEEASEVSKVDETAQGKAEKAASDQVTLYLKSLSQSTSTLAATESPPAAAQSADVANEVPDDTLMKDAPAADELDKRTGSSDNLLLTAQTSNGAPDPLPTPISRRDLPLQTGIGSGVPPKVSVEQLLQGDDMERLRDQWRGITSDVDSIKLLTEDAKKDTLLQRILELDREVKDIERELVTLNTEDDLRRSEFSSRLLCLSTGNVARNDNFPSSSTDWEGLNKLLTEQEEFSIEIISRKRVLTQKAVLLSDEKRRVQEKRLARKAAKTQDEELKQSLEKSGEKQLSDNHDASPSSDAESGVYGIAPAGLANGMKVGSQLIRYLAAIDWTTSVTNMEFNITPTETKRKKPVRKKKNW